MLDDARSVGDSMVKYVEVYIGQHVWFVFKHTARLSHIVVQCCRFRPMLLMMV
jgi:hypothetical protein